MRLVSGIGIGLALCLLQAPARAEDLTQLSARGKQLMAAGRFSEAIPVYRELVNALPRNPGPLMNLGLALHMAGQEREAASQFQQVIQLDPNNLQARIFLGAAYMGMRTPERAVAPLQTVVRAQPNNRDARLLLAETLLTLERYSSSVVHFEKLAEWDATNPKIWNGIGLSYEGLASHEFGALEKLALGSPYWLTLVAEARAKAGAIVRAYLLYREALEKMPNLRGLHPAIAAIYRRTDHPDWAVVEDAKERALPPLACGSAGAASLSPPAGAQAKAAAGSAQAGASLALKLECEFWAGRYQQVIALSKGNATQPAVYWRTRAYNELARQAFSRLAQLPSSGEVHELLATILFNQKNFPQSAKEWREALVFSPDNSFYRERLAITLSSASDFEGARPHLEDLIQQAPDSLELNYWLGYTLLGLLEADKAIPHLEKTVRANPMIFAARRELGRAYMLVGRDAEAIPHLKAALASDEEGTLYYQLSRAYRNTGKPELADQMLKKFREMEQTAKRERKTADPNAQITPP